MLFGSTDKIVNNFKVESKNNNKLEGSCIGFNESGKEIVRVPLKEPIVIRKEFDDQRDVHRISIS